MDITSPLLSPNNYAPLLVIVLMPLLGAIVNGVFGKRLGNSGVTLMALSAVGVSFVACAFTVWLLASGNHGAEEHLQPLRWDGWEWLRLSGVNDTREIPVTFGFFVDPLNGVMSLIVTGVGFLIHLYSTKYMQHDPSYHRFFAYLNLFIFSMLVLILGSGLPVLFVGWEGVGLCSYLLIGFWFTDKANAAAGSKAFIVNRIGDFGLLVAMGILVRYVGALDFSGIQSGAQQLLTPVEIWSGTSALAVVFSRPFELVGATGIAHWFTTPGYATAATLVSLALFLGCAGKSAQLPLYVWLPDAMAGPTPVSALIHAATMVTAGIYLVCRMSPVFVLSPFAMFVVASIGALTAVFAATIAFAQRDIKKVLAYSTVSQLGYMFLGVGVGAFTAGFFHVITHAFFKACLFLGAGSVIHAMHARIHDASATQDMSNMGGLRKYMPLTFATFLASWAAIVGFPFTSGFFSKDEILFKSFTLSVTSPIPGGALDTPNGPMKLFVAPAWVPSALLVLGTLGAVMTAFYMTRLVIGIFFGEFRGWAVAPASAAAASDIAGTHGHGHDSHGPGPAPHESPWAMTLPLVILGLLALAAGILNANAFVHFTPLDHFLESAFPKFDNIRPRPDSAQLERVLLLPGILAFLFGTGWAAWVYLVHKGLPAKRFTESFPAFYKLVFDKWRVDEFYRETVVGTLELIADICVWFDKWIVDGILAQASSFLVALIGSIARLAQTGRVQSYAALLVLGLGSLGWYFSMPHAEAKVAENANSGKYTLTAEAGLGYEYRWDTNGDGQFETSSFSEQKSVDVDLARTERRTVTLQVRDSFGRESIRKFRLERPPEDLSGQPPSRNDLPGSAPQPGNNP